MADTDNQTDYFQEEGETSYDKLDIKWAIIRHIDRINNLSALTQSEKQVVIGERHTMILLAVSLFEKMLAHYHDKKYKDAISGHDKESDLAKALHKYGCIMELLGRLGFLMKKVKRGKQ